MENETVKRIALLAYSKKGMALAQKTAACFSCAEIKMYAAPRLLENSSQKIDSEAKKEVPKETCAKDTAFYPESSTGKHSVGALFEWADALIFIGALGIAVRKIAPFVKDKQSDPAVLCLDEKGTYVIPVLSGHIGGANELAEELAREMGSIPVVTTATDINGRFSVDTWARQNGLAISDMKTAKVISAAILEQDVLLESDFPVVTDYPPGCRPAMFISEHDVKREERNAAPCGILISWEKRNPFATTLRLIPPVLHVGIGCRKGVLKETIAEAVERALKECHADRRAVKGIYSIDLKAQEEGLLQYCKEMGWLFHTYTAQELMQISGDFSASEFVRQVTGVDNVCERAALAEADRLILSKTAWEGVTVALAVEQYEVEF